MRRAIALLATVIGVLTLAAPALAADPAAYLADMPTVAQVNEVFTGTDDLDTAAQRMVALIRLDGLMGKLIGDRDVTGKELPAERTLRDAYSNNPGWGGIVTIVKASLPEDQRAYVPGTRFAAWYEQVNRYQTSAAFNATFRGLFPSAFQTTYASMLAAEEAMTSILPPPVTQSSWTDGPREFLTKDVVPSLPILLGMLLLTLLAAKVAGGDGDSTVKRKRQLGLDKDNPFLLLIAGKRLELTHESGVVTGVTKTAMTYVSGGSTSGYVDGRGDLVVYTTPVTSSTTMRDQFFIKQRDGHQRPVQLSGWDLALMDGHLVSMVWLGKEPVMSVNYTTQRWATDWSILKPYMRVNAGNSVGVGCVWGLILTVAAFFVFHVHPLPALVAVFLGAWIGSVGGPDMDELPNPMPAFQRDGVPRIKRALAEEARSNA